MLTFVIRDVLATVAHATGRALTLAHSRRGVDINRAGVSLAAIIFAELVLFTGARIYRKRKWLR